MKCRAILTHSNKIEIFWTNLTWRMKKHAWPTQEINTLRRCWTLSLTTMIVTMHHYPMRSFNNQSVKLWHKRKRKNVTPNKMPMTWPWILSVSPPSWSIHKRKNSNVANERPLSSYIMAETIKGFKRLTLQSRNQKFCIL